MEDNMEKVLLHTPEGVRDVYGKECAVKLTIENRLTKFLIYMDIIIFKHQLLSFLIFSVKSEALLLQRIYISSLTEKVIL